MASGNERPALSWESAVRCQLCCSDQTSVHEISIQLEEPVRIILTEKMSRKLQVQVGKYETEGI